jgi:hypothetical protein
MDEDACPTYLEKTEKMLNLEKNRVESYLNRSTLDPLVRKPCICELFLSLAISSPQLKECYTQLLKAHQSELLRKKTGVFTLLANDSLTGALALSLRLISFSFTGAFVLLSRLGAHVPAV